MTRDIPASVRGQLENLARKSGRPLQELMQYFVMERFLFRLSQSEYVDRFVLKGALMFMVWGSPQSRATRDIDLLAHAEKFEAMIKLGQLNSRMKDFYDIQVLLRQFGFDGEVLRLAIERTFANRGTMIDSEPFVFSSQFLEDSIKQAQWTAFVRKLKLDGTPDSFADVVREIQAFLLPLVQAVCFKQIFTSKWASGGPWLSHHS